MIPEYLETINIRILATTLRKAWKRVNDEAKAKHANFLIQRDQRFILNACIMYVILHNLYVLR